MNGYQRISKYKSHLMGIAVMVVVYGHTLYYHSGLQNYESLNFTEWYTLGSVEMFIFLSGFGVFQSLKKNRDAFTFYGRRLSRLAPAYLPLMLCWVIFNMLTGGMRVGEAVGNLTALGWWGQLGQQFNWYVPAVVILYLLSPLFYDCITRLGKKSVLVFPALFLVIVSGWRSNLLMAVTRFPTYYLGMYFGARYSEGKAPTKKQLWVWTLVGLAAMAVVPYYFLYRQNVLWYYGMYWILFFFSTPAGLWGMSWVMDYRSRWKVGRFLNGIWSFLGARSFEIYLTNLAFFGVCLRLGFKSWPAWICIAIIGVGIGIAYHEVIVFVQKKWKKYKADRAASSPELRAENSSS